MRHLLRGPAAAAAAAVAVEDWRTGGERGDLKTAAESSELLGLDEWGREGEGRLSGEKGEGA